MELKIRTEAHNTLTITTEVDVSETAGKYHVHLTYDRERNVYVISVPNFYISLERDDAASTKYCSYKLVELGLPRGDAEAIERIIQEVISEYKN
jgi:hypothetical protein